MSDSPDNSNISKEEALAALNSPETGSLRVLKALGKQRDVYARELAAGKQRLIVRNGFEEVCAEAAIKDYLEQMESEGAYVQVKPTLFRSGMA